MKTLTGISVSQGIAVGKIYRFTPCTPEIEGSPATSSESSARKLERYHAARKTAKSELSQAATDYAKFDEAFPAILIAQQEMLVDEEVVQQIESLIMNDQLSSVDAVNKAYNQFVELLSSVPDPLIASRADDLRDVRNRLLRILSNGQQAVHSLTEPMIITAHELLPGDLIKFNPKSILGIITENGGKNTHVAIFARSLGIPAVAGIRDDFEELIADQWVILDAVDGNILLNPAPEDITFYQHKAEILGEHNQERKHFLTTPTLTACGEKIAIGLNLNPTNRHVQFGDCDFIGLLRSEFLFMEEGEPPSEERQFRAYKSILSKAKNKPVLLRTLDAGGDKPLSYIPMESEVNPALGMRGVRLSLQHSKLFKTQLRAALRASVFGDLWIMFPMISSINDLREAKAHLDNAKIELHEKKISFNQNVKIGMMIEVPSMALIADQVAAEVDFASIGTNDLIQYLHAADRMSPASDKYYQSFSPSMLRGLQMINKAFDQANKPLSICGELAGDPMGALLLVGAGIRRLSMETSAMLDVKQILSRFTIKEMENLFNQALPLVTQDEVIMVLNDAMLIKTT